MQDPRLKQLDVTEWAIAQASLNEARSLYVRKVESNSQHHIQVDSRVAVRDFDTYTADWGS